MGPPVLAFVIAAAITLSELVTGSYARTPFLIWKSRSLYVYVLIYGLLGLVFALLLDFFVEANLLRIEGIGLDNPWIQALAVGLTIKALLHIRLFSVNAGSGNFPVGVETAVQIFEPWLLKNIELDHFNASRSLIQPRAERYPALDEVKAKIAENIPPTFEKEERAALKADLEQSETVTEAMELMLYYLGKKTFDRVFPL